ncbi:hypothetical protein GF415_01425 [Candidatus Micrarchaeota archaeon]|nr:hypothetical protein [Candidatus Micrarchaeota archaeon]
MKVRLTPELSYLIGFWKERRTKEGIGIRGEEEQLSIFAQAALELELTEPDKLLTQTGEEGNDSMYFYHTSYRKFFQKVIDDELERFKYKNEYSANFLAGLFDAVGSITEDGKVFLSKCTQKDEMLLYRIGFNPLRKGKSTYFTRPVKFLRYIHPFTRHYKDHPVFEKI